MQNRLFVSLRFARFVTWPILGIALLVSPASAIQVCPDSVDTSCVNACTFEVPILVSDFTFVDAVGLDFVWTTAGVNLRGWRRGNLVRAWQVFELYPPSAGRVRLGGFDSLGSSATGNDTLVVFEFQTSGNNLCMNYRTEALVDDFATAAPCSGAARVILEHPPAGRGMVYLAPHGAISHGCCFFTPDHSFVDVYAQLPDTGNWSGTEFRVEVSPPVPGATFHWQPWSLEVTASEGDPIDNTADPGDVSGVRVHFSCRRYQGPLLLGTIEVTGLNDLGYLLVKQHNQPSEARFGCATFYTCGTCATSGCMFAVEVEGSEPIVYRAKINASCDTMGQCVGITARTWGSLKQLYR